MPNLTTNSKNIGSALQYGSVQSTRTNKSNKIGKLTSKKDKERELVTMLLIKSGLEMLTMVSFKIWNETVGVFVWNTEMGCQNKNRKKRPTKRL